MNVLVFNNCFNQLLDEVSKKQIFLIRDFNINLLNCNDEHHNVNEFFDAIKFYKSLCFALNKTYYSIKNSY